LAEEKFEDLKATREIKIVPVPIIMDEKGWIYFMVTNAEKQVMLYRVNTN
jgi:hypothetical protein